MDELNAIVSDVAKKVALFPQAKRQIRRVIIELYIKVFDLFAKLMKWYSKNNHGLKILQKDCYSDFEAELSGIRRWADLIKSEVLTNLVLELRQARQEDRQYQRHFLEELQRVSQIAGKYYEVQKSTSAQQVVQREQLLLASPDLQHQSFVDLMTVKFNQHFKVLGASQIVTLASMAEAMTANHLPAGVSENALSVHTGNGCPGMVAQTPETTPCNTQTLEELPNSLPSARAQSRDDIERYSRVLDQWYPDGHTLPLRQTRGPVSQPVLHDKTTAQISQWTRAQRSSILCVQFPYSPGQATIGGELASFVVSTARKADYPVISYFCTLPRNGVAEGRSLQTVGLCEMMVSLLRQLAAILQDPLPAASTVSLEEKRFLELDGTLKTWDQMLSLFAELLSLASRSMLVVLHGLQWLNSEATTAPIQELLGVVRKSIDELGQPAAQIIKVLLVTDGQSRAAKGCLRRGEYLVDEGRLQPGRRLAYP